MGKKDLSATLLRLIKVFIPITAIMILFEIMFMVPEVNNFFINLATGSTGMVLYIVLWLLFCLQCNILNIPAVMLLELSMNMGLDCLSWWYILFVMSAYMVGCITSYWLGYKFGSKAVKWIAGDEKEFDKWRNVMNRKGKWYYFITVLLPVFPDDILTICVGALHFNFKFYLFSNLIGRTVGLIAMLLTLQFVGNISGNIPFMLILWGLALIVEIIGYIILIKRVDKNKPKAYNNNEELNMANTKTKKVEQEIETKVETAVKVEKEVKVEKRKEDMVNHPNHYTYSKYETIDVIDEWGLDYEIGNAVKYLSRYKHKGKPVEDLQKAVWYINREIEKLQKGE